MVINRRRLISSLSSAALAAASEPAFLSFAALAATVEPADAGLHFHGSGPALVKITAFGASNTQDAAYNNNQCYVTQSTGLFKVSTIIANAAEAGISAAQGNATELLSHAAINFDATKTFNILTLQFGGSATGDLSSDPASVTPYYNNLVGMAQKWKALGAGAKVVCLTTYGYGCVDSAMVTNFNSAETLIKANTTDFNAVLDCTAASAIFTPSTSCPIAAITADCSHLTQAGNALLVSAYIAAVNSVF